MRPRNRHIATINSNYYYVLFRDNNRLAEAKAFIYALLFDSSIGGCSQKNCPHTHIGGQSSKSTSAESLHVVSYRAYDKRDQNLWVTNTQEKSGLNPIKPQPRSCG